MTWSKVRCLKVFVTIATYLPSCFLIQFLEQLLKFPVNFTLKSQRIYNFLITKELILLLPNFGIFFTSQPP